MLELDHVTRRFGALVALDAVSLRVEAGQVVGFVGSNGAGKTTAMRVIMGILDAHEGQVRFDGEVVRRGERRRFGYLPEERGLYPKVPVIRQLRYIGRLHGLGSREAREHGMALLDRLGLADRAREPVQRLSLGNQQRVQLAAALVHDPQLLVLDEPFSGLDPIGVDALAGLMAERAALGVPVLFSSHQLDLVERLCDAVVIIHKGRIAAAGTVDDLRTSRGARVLRVAFAPEGTGADDADRAAESGPSRATLGHAFDPATLPGVRVIQAGGLRWRLGVEEDVDEQVVLDAARAAGRVIDFGFEVPSLAEVYRDVLAS